MAQGDLAGAKAQFRWTIEARQRLGHVAIGALAEANLGQALMRERSFKEARARLESSLRDFRSIKARAFEVDVELRIAALLYEEGHTERAYQSARKALVSAAKLNLGPVEENAHILLGRIAIERRRWRNAERHLDSALQMARRARDRHGEARALAALGALQESRDSSLGMGATQFRRALRLFRRLGAQMEVAEVEQRLLGMRASR
jgi:uncharacterized protein HemY